MTRHSFFAAAVAAALVTAPLAAQSATQDQNGAPTTATVVVTAPTADTPAARGPVASGLTVGVRAERSGVAPAPMPPKDNPVGHNPAMMIVGGAALIIGAVVGGTAGTIIMIAGGVIGLVGLWNYLQ